MSDITNCEIPDCPMNRESGRDNPAICPKCRKEVVWTITGGQVTDPDLPSDKTMDKAG